MGLSHKSREYEEDPCENCSKALGETVINNLYVCYKCAKKLKKSLKITKGESPNDYLSTDKVSN